MKKMMVFLLSLILVEMAMAVNIATITDFGDGTVVKDCVSISSGESVYDVYKELDSNRDDIDVDFDGDIIPPINPFIKGINGYEGRSVDLTTFEGWGFWITNGWGFWITNGANNDFTDPPELAPGWGMGIGDYTMTNSEVIGVGYGITEFNADWTVKTPQPVPSFEPYESICEKLAIEEVKAYVDGDKDTLDEGDKLKDVKPESKLKLKVDVKNLHEEDIEISDVTITATIKDIDDNEDLEEESDSFDLDADDTNIETINFEIPLEVEDGDYDLILEIKGDDTRGVDYSKTYEYSIEVEKQKHDVKIRRAELTSSNLKCSRTTSLDVSVMNMGTNEEDVSLKVSNSELEISEQTSFELGEDPFDDDNRYSSRFTITVDEDAEAGVYPITVRADYEGKTTGKVVELTVSDCEKKVGEEEVIETVDLEQGTGLNDITANVVKTIGDEDNSVVKEKFKISNLVIVVSVLVYIGVIVGGVALVVKLVKG
tara:strand:+ start:347 stop:1801 length:1455 start_codon:yes stop_codon:yes gene_type:complete